MRLHVLLAATMLLVCLAARADTIATFSAIDSVTGSLDGSIVMDTNTGYVLAGEVGLFGLAGYQLTPSEQIFDESEYTNFYAQFFWGPYASLASGQILGGYDYEIYEPPCDDLVASGYGVFEEVITTPEVPSFAMLGTGLLGLAGVMRKRFA